MLFKTIKRDGWEVIDWIVKNGGSEPISSGTPVCWDIASAKDGSVVKPLDVLMAVPAGVAIDNSGARGSYDSVGRVRAYGYCKVNYSGSAITPGAELVATSGKTYLTLGVTFVHNSSTAEAVNLPKVFAVAATTSGTTTGVVPVEAFVRALK